MQLKYLNYILVTNTFLKIYVVNNYIVTNTVYLVITTRIIHILFLERKTIFEFCLHTFFSIIDLYNRNSYKRICFLIFKETIVSL